MYGLAVEELDGPELQLTGLGRQQALVQDFVWDVVELAVDDASSRRHFEQAGELVTHREEADCR
jgi:hypothetical protein